LVAVCLLVILFVVVAAVAVVCRCHSSAQKCFTHWFWPVHVMSKSYSYGLGTCLTT